MISVRINKMIFCIIIIIIIIIINLIRTLVANLLN